MVDDSKTIIQSDLELLHDYGHCRWIKTPEDMLEVSDYEYNKIKDTLVEIRYVERYGDNVGAVMIALQRKSYIPYALIAISVWIIFSGLLFGAGVLLSINGLPSHLTQMSHLRLYDILGIGSVSLIVFGIVTLAIMIIIAGVLDHIEELNALKNKVVEEYGLGDKKKR